MSDLRDLRDIEQVMITYATSVDQADLERFATCFTEDLVTTGFRDGPFEGRDAFLAWVDDAISNRYRGTHHQISTQEATVDGDAGHLRSHVQASHVLADDPASMMVLWAVYDDRLVRTDDGWRITHHHLEVLIGPRRLATAAWP